ncbi:DisA bacterial checkpoint controller nucleotide-binding protein [Desulfosporosinus acididurans]|uniref:DisA bacterial checkpoint controller nucleotide-binding protein n=1 Tax=Desulfosporosinus acididurans TaxID=476652 RepID=A0A0J1FR52_9FIRM|nr:DNA integrity scanning protein DisA nucleotide-binding domain protein [Desulfosporosinus acididurans]KLU65777.1 DisA bacterial checkpoint controller nucleotide-binding protein [Desulfosporosinus acididurans]
MFAFDSEIIERRNRQHTEIKEKIQKEFKKISKDNLFSKSILGIYTIDIYLYQDKGSEPEFYIYPEHDLSPKVDNKILNRLNTQFIHDIKDERITLEISSLITNTFKDLGPTSEYWCSNSEIYTDMLKIKDLLHSHYHFALIEFNKNKYKDNLFFNGKIHPFIECIKYKWIHNWQENNYDEIFRRSARNANNFLYACFDHINIISTFKYEGSFNCGKLLFIKENIEDTLKPDKNDEMFELIKPVKLNDYKNIRKLLQMCKQDYFLVLDENYEAHYFCKIPVLQDEHISVEFSSYFSWRVLIGGKELISCSNMQAFLPSRNENDNDLLQKIESTFVNEQVDTSLIMEMVNNIKQQKKGSMLVVANNAKEEANRLSTSAITIRPQRMNAALVNCISEIDGAILTNSNGECYAIGVILDGQASEKGDPARGARYNSALRYAHLQRSKHEKCLIFVISEDKYFDVISSTDL